MSEHHPLCPADTAKGSLVRENAIALCLTWSICDRLNMATDKGRADERKAAAERVLGALDTERIKWQYRVDTSDGEESMIGRRYIDYVEAMERAIELAAAALGEDSDE